MAKTTKKKKKTGKKKSVNGRISKFIDNFINSDNGTQSAIDAGYSKNGANRTAHRLLTNPDILAEIDRRRKEITEKAGITAQDVINEIAKIAFLKSSDVFNYYDQIIKTKDGPKTVSKAYLKPESELTDAALSSIGAIKETNQGLEIKLYDKQKALDSLKPYFGIDNDAAVDKARRISKGEDPQDKKDVTEGMSINDVEAKIKELEQ
ncbi:terminase small subunit [Candidatus Pacearchaeota archaeon]|nr:terminase small subunit [Candidatus Pacearchaeota archaeon]